MSIRIMSAVWDGSPYEHTMLLVHLCLADIANDDGYCWPSVGWIAKKCRLDERYTRRLLNQMVQDGTIEKGVREGKKNTNVYLIRVTPGLQTRVLGPEGLQTRVPETGQPRVPRPPNPSIDPSGSKEKKPEASKWEDLKAIYRKHGVDVEAEFRDAQAWIVAHPGRKFSLDFYRKWLKKASEGIAPSRPKVELVVSENELTLEAWKAAR